MVIMKKLHIAGIRLFHYLKYQCYRYSAWEHPKALKIIYGIVVGALLLPVMKVIVFSVISLVVFLSIARYLGPVAVETDNDDDLGYKFEKTPYGYSDGNWHYDD